MNFILFLENLQNRSFLASHFESPFDDANLTVWADYLEENGDAEISQLLRLAVKGHKREGGREYANQVQALFHALNQRLQGKAHFINDHTFDFGKRKRYIVTFKGIEALNTRDNRYYDLPHRQWTPQIVEATIYLILRRLTANPDKRYKDDDKYWLERPEGLGKKQLYQALLQFSKILNQTIVTEMGFGLGHIGITAWVSLSAEHLISVLRNMKNHHVDSSIDSQIIREMARRCRDLLQELNELMEHRGLIGIINNATVHLLLSELGVYLN